MISYEEANKIIAKEFSKLDLELEEVPLLESLNRVLAEDVIADVNLPPFNNSAMDGYAIRFNEKIKEWKIIGEIAAGKYSQFVINEHSAVRIMTGGKLPDNCDTIIPIEDVDEEEGKVSLKPEVKIKKGNHIRRTGEDLKKDETAIKKFTMLKPQHLAVAASCGKSRLKIFRRLKIGVLATGDELISISETPTEDKIRTSNSFSILSLAKEMNMEAVDLGLAKDFQKEIKEKITSGLKQNIDVLITTGGVSVGKYDLMQEFFSELGIEKKFWRMNIKPGKPIYFGVLKNSDRTTLVFGLPGNPVSCFVGFLVFIKNNIEKFYRAEINRNLIAKLQNKLKKKDSKRHFMRGIVSQSAKGDWIVTSEFTQSSSNLVETSRANCLIVVEENRINPKKGEMVECILI